MKKKILVVESDEDICQIISYILSEEGYDTILCKTETGIFDIIHTNKPDVILLDVVKPTEQGTELCRAIKAAETTRHIPVVVLSTHAKAEEVKNLCADEVVKKPFDISALVNIVKEQLAV
ncbi:MAG: response regulator [Pyrinomonadaceae bacterium]|nr:response regulator [Sphingobacteriaceae bacterium]